MQDFVERGGSTDEKAIACLGRQVATGLKHVHGKGYAQASSSPRNILDRNGIAKLADFGIASKCDNEASTSTFVGTAQYMSPERIRGDAYTTAADVWGLGVSLLAVVRGSAPFGSQEKNNEDAEYWRLVGEVVEAPAPSLPSEWTEPAKDCLEACLAKDAVERPTADELLVMDFLAAAPGPSPQYFFAGQAPRDALRHET